MKFNIESLHQKYVLKFKGSDVESSGDYKTLVNTCCALCAQLGISEDEFHSKEFRNFVEDMNDDNTYAIIISNKGDRKYIMWGIHFEFSRLNK